MITDSKCCALSFPWSKCCGCRCACVFARHGILTLAWELRRTTAASPVLQRSDSRLQLQDTPSAYTLEPPAAALQRIRLKCLPHARPTVKYHAEASFVTKEERVVLPDGTIYLLRTTWTADPTSATRRSQDTQTDAHELAN